MDKSVDFYSLHHLQSAKVIDCDILVVRPRNNNFLSKGPYQTRIVSLEVQTQEIGNFVFQQIDFVLGHFVGK